MALRKPYVGPVSAEMTAWAKSLVADPVRYPYGSEIAQSFGDKRILARIEHHTWTMVNGVKKLGHYRGCTLYEIVETDLVKDPI